MHTRCVFFLELPEEQYQLYDSDDEFILEKNQFTAKVLSSVVPDDDGPRDIDNERGTDDEETNDEISNPDLEDGESFLCKAAIAGDLLTTQ